MDSGTQCYQRFLNGDQGALEEIVFLYNRKLILFINQSVNNLSEAEDIAAEAFLDLITKKPRFRQESSFKTYLFAIGRNKALNYLRKQSRHSSVPIEDIQLVEQNQILEELEWDEEQRALMRALNNLLPDYRQVLHLIYFEELSYREAATVLRKSEKQINNLAYRAKNALRDAMQQEVT
ncbi:MAG TPA: RNA polymerase subunit sigma-24 [Clostridiales bacterium]|nr:RNA polymerase subunit sigma-24 [Clostridiales bacterium]